MITGLAFGTTRGGATGGRSWYTDHTTARLRLDPEVPETVDRPRPRQLAAVSHERALQGALGAPILTACTTLPGPHGTAYPVAKHPTTGIPFVWSLWAPHRKLLIDNFSQGLPEPEELTARAAYAATHGLRYAIVEPGFTLTLDDLVALAGREGS